MNRSTDIINTFVAFTVISISILFSCVVAADDGPVIVNVDNFVRAETAAQFDLALKLTGGINQWLHVRQPQPLNQ